MLILHSFNIVSFLIDDSNGITFLYLVKSELFVLNVLSLSGYIVMLVVEISFEVSKSIYFMSSFYFVSYTVPLVSSFGVVKLFYMVSLPTKFTVHSSLQLGLRIETYFQCKIKEVLLWVQIESGWGFSCSFSWIIIN